MNQHEESPVIGRGTAAVLSAAFLALIVTPPLHQLACGGKEINRFARLLHRLPSPRSLRAFETALASDSLLAGKARKAYRSLACRVIREGSDSVLVGEDGILFYRQDVEFCALPPRGDGGASPSVFAAAAATIRDYHHQLQARGIHLVVAPLPVAPVLYPEKVWPGYPVEKGPAWNAGMPAWIASLREHGVDVVDLAPALWRARQAGCRCSSGTTPTGRRRG